MIHWILRKKAEFKLNRAIKKAELQRTKTGRRHYVMMVEGARLIILNRDSLKHYNKTAKKKITSFELSNMCLYMTKQGKI
jgi:hypothetical protein